MNGIESNRRELNRAQAAGDHEKAARVRGELLKLHRRAFRRALALDDQSAAEEIHREMTRDLAPLLPAPAGTSAMLLDTRRELSRQAITTLLGPLELDRLMSRPEPFVAITESEDGAVRVIASIADERSLGEFLRLLLASQGSVSIRHDLEIALVGALEAITDSLIFIGVGAAAWDT